MSSKTKAGTYRVRWRENGLMQSQNFKRKVDAEQFKAKQKLGLIQPIASPVVLDDRITFENFVEIWIRDYALVHKTEGSVIYDKQLIRDYMMPFWGKMYLEDLSKRDIAKLQGSLTAEGRLAPKTINNITGLVKKILGDAVKWDYLEKNPAENLTPIKIPEQDFDFWTFEERDRFLKWAKINDYALYEVVAFAVYTGLRKGEQAGLLRDAIDLERRQIIVKRALSEKTGDLDEYTKGKKIRRLPMNKVIYDILKSRASLPLKAPVLPFDYDHIVERRLKPAAEQAGVSLITFHDLRHTIASHLAMLGVGIFTIKELLGHSDIKTTLRYMHLAPGHLAGVTDVLLKVQATSPSFADDEKSPEEIFDVLESKGT